MNKKLICFSLGLLLIFNSYLSLSSMQETEDDIKQVTPKPGYIVEFRFGDPKNGLPITKSLKIDKFSFDKSRILETTHSEGDIIEPYQIFKIKLNFEDNETYISPSEISKFRNDEMLEEEYKKLFNDITFKVEDKTMIFRWSPKSQSCLHYSSPLGKFSWGAFERGSYSKKDRLTGLYVNTVECVFCEK